MIYRIGYCGLKSIADAFRVDIIIKQNNKWNDIKITSSNPLFGRKCYICYQNDCHYDLCLTSYNVNGVGKIIDICSPASAPLPSSSSSSKTSSLKAASSTKPGTMDAIEFNSAFVNAMNAAANCKSITLAPLPALSRASPPEQCVQATSVELNKKETGLNVLNSPDLNIDSDLEDDFDINDDLKNDNANVNDDDSADEFDCLVK